MRRWVIRWRLILLGLVASVPFLVTACGLFLGLQEGQLVPDGGSDDGQTPADVAAYDGGHVDPDADIADCGAGARVAEGGLYVVEGATGIACTMANPCGHVMDAISVSKAAKTQDVIHVAGHFTEAIDLGGLQPNVRIEGGWDADAGWVPECTRKAAVITAPATANTTVTASHVGPITLSLLTINSKQQSDVKVGESLYGVVGDSATLNLENVFVTVAAGGKGTDGSVGMTGSGATKCNPPSDGGVGGVGGAGPGAAVAAITSNGFAALPGVNGAPGGPGEPGSDGADAGCATSDSCSGVMVDGGGMCDCKINAPTTVCGGQGTGGCGGLGGGGGFGGQSGGSAAAIYAWGGTINVTGGALSVAGGGFGGSGGGGGSGAPGSTGNVGSNGPGYRSSVTCPSSLPTSCIYVGMECASSGVFASGPPGGAAGGPGGVGGTGGQGGGGAGGSSYCWVAAGNGAAINVDAATQKGCGSPGGGGNVGGNNGAAGQGYP